MRDSVRGLSARVSYLRFEGDLDGVAFRLGGESVVRVTADAQDHFEGHGTPYEAAPGRHRLIVYRHGDTVLSEDVQIESNEIHVVQVP